ncbi:hypothetical protein BH09MYX1_BH09MYX1_17220 [soil metagenome]
MRFTACTAWDRRSALASAALAALCFVVALLLSAGTDEGGVPWADRVMRTLPVVPLASALATILLLRTMQRRGELLAFAALGFPPSRAALPVVIGAALPAIALVGVTLASTHADVHTFFPKVDVDSLTWDGERFVDLSRGIRVLADGTLVHVPKGETALAIGVPWAAKWAVGITLAISALAIPIHVAASFPDRRLRAAILVFAGIAPTIVLFQLAAQGIVPALVCVVPPALLLCGAPFCYREAT